MFQNYLKVSWRNMTRHRGFYILNILGLAIGIACTILIYLYVDYELNFDSFHTQSDRVFRIAVDGVAGNTQIYQTFTPAPLPEAMYREYPEVEKITRISQWNEVKTRHQDRVFNENRVFCVDSTFLDIFTFPMIEGNPEEALTAPYSIVLTRSMVEKYFRESDPLNKTIRLDTIDFKITGVVEDVPEQSHFHFDFLVSLTSFDGFYNGTNWWWNNFSTYLLLNPNADYKTVEAKFPDFVEKYLFKGRSYAEARAKGNKWEYYLQPLTTIHLNSNLAGEFEANGNERYIYIFIVVALFILGMACVNFMNLNTAKSGRRAKEVGIRKVSGATRLKLILQFITEALVITVISTVIALLLVELLLPYFRDFTNRSLTLPFYNHPVTLLPLFLLVLVIGIISGSYPAFVLSSFHPVKVLKGGNLKNPKGTSLRNVLVIFQFSVSIFLIIGTFVVYGQLQMIRNKNLGFDKEHVVVIKNAYLLGNQSKVFKQELAQNPDIISVAGTHRMPGMRLNNIGFGAEGIEDSFTLNLLLCDPSFRDVMKFELVKGRFFSNDHKTDSTAMVINESAMKLIGWEDPLGKKINDWGDVQTDFHVIGVVKDFHYESMHEKVRPQAFLFLGGAYDWDERFIAIRIRPGTQAAVINFLQDKWHEFSIELPFSYSFFDQDYNALYQNEKQTRDLMIIFSVLAVFIACLGLLGLASYMAERRTKEIGIRKTFGATSTNIVWTFSREFAKWILIANLITWPVAWFAAERWLQNFEFRIHPGLWIFFTAAFIGLVITVISISYQSWKASRTKPMDSLRYE